MRTLSILLLAGMAAILAHGAPAPSPPKPAEPLPAELVKAWEKAGTGTGMSFRPAQRIRPFYPEERDPSRRFS